jgi:hypothetical protein
MNLHSRRPRAATLRLRVLKADTKGYSGSNERPTVARIPRHFAASTQAIAASGDHPTDQTPLSRLLTFSSGIRTLVAVLVFVAVLLLRTLGMWKTDLVSVGETIMRAVIYARYASELQRKPVAGFNWG